MKTNPWMIVSLVLACVCGFLVGLLVSQPAEVSAEKHDWDYSISISAAGQMWATRWDRNAEAPLPEMMLLTWSGHFPTFELDELTNNNGKWCKTVLTDTDAEFKRIMDEDMELLDDPELKRLWEEAKKEMEKQD